MSAVSLAPIFERFLVVLVPFLPAFAIFLALVLEFLLVIFPAIFPIVVIVRSRDAERECDN
jgi:hypothetical protein